jgi:hypothetical protein
MNDIVATILVALLRERFNKRPILYGVILPSVGVIGSWCLVILSIFLISLLVSCSVVNPLPGLCYTDKTGTYLCDDNNKPSATDNNPEGQRAPDQISETQGIIFPNTTSKPLQSPVTLKKLEDLLNN